MTIWGFILLPVLNPHSYVSGLEPKLSGPIFKYPLLSPNTPYDLQIPSPALQILPGARSINCKTTLPWLGLGVFGLNTPRPPPPCLGVFKPNTPLRRGGFTL